MWGFEDGAHNRASTRLWSKIRSQLWLLSFITFAGMRSRTSTGLALTTDSCRKAESLSVLRANFFSQIKTVLSQNQRRTVSYSRSSGCKTGQYSSHGTEYKAANATETVMVCMFSKTRAMH